MTPEQLLAMASVFEVDRRGSEQDRLLVMRVERVWQRDGSALWAVRLNGHCLSLKGRWDYEPLSSSRTDAWLTAHRFATRDAAIDAAMGCRA